MLRSRAINPARRLRNTKSLKVTKKAGNNQHITSTTKAHGDPWAFAFGVAFLVVR
jgi:hypothetical protein